ncbi:MAG: hypothetical protein ACK5LY_00635 [Lachnospirales bacterium]
MTNINADDVSYIQIRDGSTGLYHYFASEEDINHIIKNFNDVKVTPDKLSIGYLGWAYNVNIFGGNNKELKEFTINGSDYIRKDPFFYKAVEGKIDLANIENLIKEKEVVLQENIEDVVLWTVK